MVMLVMVSSSMLALPLMNTVGQGVVLDFGGTCRQHVRIVAVVHYRMTRVNGQHFAAGQHAKSIDRAVNGQIVATTKPGKCRDSFLLISIRYPSSS